jgi:hypothetical protein
MQITMQVENTCFHGAIHHSSPPPAQYHAPDIQAVETPHAVQPQDKLDCETDFDQRWWCHRVRLHPWEILCGDELGCVSGPMAL